MIIEVFSSDTGKIIEEFYLSDAYHNNDEYIEDQITKRYSWLNLSYPDWDYQVKGEQFTLILAI